MGRTVNWQSREGGSDFKEGGTSESGVDNWGSKMFVVHGRKPTLFLPAGSPSESGGSEKTFEASLSAIPRENRPDICPRKLESGGGLGSRISSIDMLSSSKNYRRNFSIIEVEYDPRTVANRKNQTESTQE